MIFLKYYHCFSYGRDQEPNFQLLSTEDRKYSETDLEYILEELSSEYWYSEHYRGIDHAVVKVDELPLSERDRLIEEYVREKSHLEARWNGILEVLEELDYNISVE